MLPTPASRAAPGPGQLLSVTAVPAARPGRVVVEVTGEIDAYTAPVLDLCLQSQAARPAVREIVADLRRVTLLDAAGVTALARAQRRCRTRGARLMIVTGGRRDVLRVLRLTGLADVVTVDPVAEEQVQTADDRAAAHVSPRARRGDTHGRCADEHQPSFTGTEAASGCGVAAPSDSVLSLSIDPSAARLVRRSVHVAAPVR